MSSETTVPVCLWDIDQVKPVWSDYWIGYVLKEFDLDNPPLWAFGVCLKRVISKLDIPVCVIARLAEFYLQGAEREGPMPNLLPLPLPYVSSEEELETWCVFPCNLKRRMVGYDDGCGLYSHQKWLFHAQFFSADALGI